MYNRLYGYHADERSAYPNPAHQPGCTLPYLTLPYCSPSRQALRVEFPREIQITERRQFVHRRAATVWSEREARRSDATRLRWRCDDPLDAAAGARAVANDYHRQTGYPTQVIADEAQDGMLPDGDVEADNPLKKMLHEDRDKALKVQVATQDPQDLEYTPLKQCKYWVWVGEWSTFHRGFINYFDLPKSELPTEPYEVVVFDKRMNVLHRTETKEVYA